MPVLDSGKSNTVPPRQPTDSDLDLLSSAQGVELSARELYIAALDNGHFSDLQVVVLELFRDHHIAYAQALNGILGKASTSERNDAKGRQELDSGPCDVVP